jgi:hypothetical protein
MMMMVMVTVMVMVMVMMMMLSSLFLLLLLRPQYKIQLLQAYNKRRTQLEECITESLASGVYTHMHPVHWQNRTTVMI